MPAAPTGVHPYDNSTRDNTWLQRQLDHIWTSWFSDVERLNPVTIQFVRPWKRRLGVIYLTDDGCMSFIGINGLLRDIRVPYTICLITIAHELTHYCHGFGSNHPRRYHHPHRGNVVARELKRRGLARELSFYLEWTAERWFELLDDLQVNPATGTAEWFGDEPQEKVAAQI